MRDLTKFKKPKAARILGGALGLLLVLTLVLMPVPVLAVPQMPHQFYGTVTIGKDLAPEGTIVSAQIGGEYRSTTVDAKGRYGYSPDYGGTGIFKVLADDPGTPEKEGGVAGETVEFYVLNTLAGQYKFEIWGITQLNLTVAAPAPEPNISVSPTSKNFGEVTVGSSSSPQTFTVSNVGTATLTITNITISGPGSEEFSMSPYPGTIPAGDSAGVNVTFSPTSTGSKSATLAITSNDPDEATVEVSLSGTGVSVTPPPGPPPGTTDVGGMVSAAGVFTRSVTALSEDGLCTLDIPEGTVGLTEELEPLTEITIVIMDEPPPPPEAAHIIGLVYDFQPSGATFEPPIPLTFSYDPADIPEGVAEEDLVLAFYDEATGEWIELEGVVDPVTNTITALVAHFTAFGATFIPAPAAFSLSGLEVSPAEVEIGDTITISAVVENTSEKEGTCEVTLKVNDEVEETKNVALEPGASETVTFTTSRDVAGSYSVDVNGLTGSFAVKAPPELPPEEAPPEEISPEVKPISWPVIGGIIAAAVVVVGLLIFLLVRRRRAY